jgi:hypothetical protein
LLLSRALVPLNYCQSTKGSKVKEEEEEEEDYPILERYQGKFCCASLCRVATITIVPYAHHNHIPSGVH